MSSVVANGDRRAAALTNRAFAADVVLAYARQPDEPGEFLRLTLGGVDMFARHMKAALRILTDMERAAAAGAARAHLDELFDTFSTEYAAAPERHRRKLREAFLGTKNWGGGEVWKNGATYFRRFSSLERDPRDLRRALVLVSLTDGGNDTRDAVMVMDDLIVWARGANITHEGIFAEIAGMSSPEDRFGMGSIRSLLEARGMALPNR
jgi:hypothetical protein